MSMPPAEPRRIRVGDADRERTIALLQEATAEGRLTIEELEERVERAASARWQDDLDALIADLPAGNRPARATVPAPSVGSHFPDVPEDAMELRSQGFTTVRAGQWRVPEWIVVRPQFWGVVLNMLDAIPPASGEIDVVVEGAYGALNNINPEGWGVDHSRLRVPDNGWAVSSVAPRKAERGKPQIRLWGDQRNGRVVVRRERWYDSWYHGTSRR